MEYKLLTEDERDEMIANTLLAQERDHFSHASNIERYTAMLEDLPEGPFRDRVAGLLQETRSRIAEVESIIAKTEPQLPPRARLDAAAARVLAREETTRTVR